MVFQTERDAKKLLYPFQLFRIRGSSHFQALSVELPRILPFLLWIRLFKKKKEKKFQVCALYMGNW